MLSYLWLICSVLCAFGTLSCGEQEPIVEEEIRTDGGGQILAQIADETITVRDFERFVAELPAWTASAKEGSAQVRDYLQTLIDRILILRRARARGLEKNPKVRAALKGAVKKRLGQEVARRQIQPQIAIGEAELQRAFVERHWNRKLKVAHIVVHTREGVSEVAAALRAGRPFDEVARQFSQYPRSAERGGELPHYYSPGAATPAVRHAVFHLEVGQISEPVPNPRGYEIFKVLDAQEGAYEEVGDKIRKELIREELSAVRRTHIDSLAQLFQLEPDRQGLGALMAILRQVEQERVGRLSAATSETVLFRYAGGSIRLDEAVAQSPFIRRGKGVRDSLKVIDALERDVVVPQLLLLWARELGIDQEPDIKTWVERREEEVLIREMRHLEVARQVVVSEREVLQYYEDNKGNYRTPTEVGIAEIQVGDESEARHLLEQMRSDLHRAAPLIALLRRLGQKLESEQATGEELEALRHLGDDPPVFAWLRRRLAGEEATVQFLEEVAGASSPKDLAEQYIVQQLAVAHSLRPESREAEGHYHLRWYDEVRFGALVGEAMEAEIGALIGPIESDSFYSIAKVLNRQESTIRPFAEVEERLTSRLRREKESIMFSHWLEALRDSYRDEVALFDKNIEGLGRKLRAADPIDR